MDAEDAVRLRRAIARLARQLNSSATDEGLTPTQASVLGLIVGRGPIGLPELMRLEHLNPTMLSRVVGKLDDAGLVERVVDAADRRVVTVEVTAAGRRTHQVVRDERNRTLTALLEALPGDQARAVLTALPALEALSLGMSA